ncbi:TJAP1 protein, partial [Polypterus senegalus]|nr:TJAP1 protein [Polypterus senegalus]
MEQQIPESVSSQFKGFPKLRRGQSKSEDQLLQEDEMLLTKEEGRLFKAASLERSLVFSDGTKVIVKPIQPKMSSFNLVPSKGILKNGKGCGTTKAETLFRKAKSMEVISDRAATGKTCSSVGSGSCGQACRTKDITGMGEKDRSGSVTSMKESFVEEKRKFSEFLNEITRQIFSPSSLTSLGLPLNPQKPAVSSKTIDEQQQSLTQLDPPRRPGGNKGCPSPDRSSVASSHYSGTNNEVSTPLHPGSSRITRHQTKPGASRHTDASTSPENSPSPARLPHHSHHDASSKKHKFCRLTNASTSPELSPLLPRHHHYHLQQLAVSPERIQSSPNHQSRSHSHAMQTKVECDMDHQETIEIHHNPQHSSQGSQGSHSGKSDSSKLVDTTPSTTSTTSPSPDHLDKQEQIGDGQGLHYYLFKDMQTDTDRVQFLQQQNKKLQKYLAKTASKMEKMGSEFKNSHHQLETELQQAKEELDIFRDNFQRLQENYSSTQQANHILEEKLQTIACSIEAERETLNQRITDLSKQLLSTQNILNNLETINIPALLQKALGKNLLEENEEQADQSLLSFSVLSPPSAFKDPEGTKTELQAEEKSLRFSEQTLGRMGSLPEEDESDWSDKDQEEPVVSMLALSRGKIEPKGNHRMTAFSPWKQQSVSTESQPRINSGEEEVKRPSRSLQIPHFEDGLHHESFLMPVTDSSLPRSRKLYDLSLNSEGLQRSYPIEKSPPIRMLSVSLEEIRIRSNSTNQDPHQQSLSDFQVKPTETHHSLNHSSNRSSEDSDEDIYQNWKENFKGRIHVVSNSSGKPPLSGGMVPAKSQLVQREDEIIYHQLSSPVMEKQGQRHWRKNCGPVNNSALNVDSQKAVWGQDKITATKHIDKSTAEETIVPIQEGRGPSHLKLCIHHKLSPFS